MLSSIISPNVPQYTAVSTTPHALETGHAHDDAEDDEERILRGAAIQVVRQHVVPGARFFGLGALPTFPVFTPGPTHAPAGDEEAACAYIDDSCSVPPSTDSTAIDVGVQVELDLVA